MLTRRILVTVAALRLAAVSRSVSRVVVSATYAATAVRRVVVTLIGTALLARTLSVVCYGL